MLAINQKKYEIFQESTNKNSLINKNRISSLHMNSPIIQNHNLIENNNFIYNQQQDKLKFLSPFQLGNFHVSKQLKENKCFTSDSNRQVDSEKIKYNMKKKIELQISKLDLNSSNHNNSRKSNTLTQRYIISARDHTANEMINKNEILEKKIIKKFKIKDNPNNLIEQLIKKQSKAVLNQ